MVRRDLVAMFGETLGEVGDHILDNALMVGGDHRVEIVLARIFDGLLRAGEGDPDGGMGLLIGARPDGDVLVLPELALMGKELLGPGAQHDLHALLEARP